MKLVAIGDIHGRDVWKIIVESERPDITVFIADYLDSFNISPIDQLKNLNEIIEFKKQYPENVILLVGNHEYHYLKGTMQRGEYYAGFQSAQAFNYQILIEQNLSLFNACYRNENVLFSHAGISVEWIKINDDVLDPEVTIDEFVNDVFKYQPNRFKLSGKNPYGDSADCSPIWIRPKSLMKANKKSDLHKKYIQVVGHTVQNSIDIKGKSTGGKYYFIDTLGTSGEYLIIEDGKFRTAKINSK